MSGHSLGPWKLVEDGGDLLINAADGIPVLWPANVPGEPEDWSDALGTGEVGEASSNRSLADARLIAAAPELLEALERLCEVGCDRLDSAWAEARALVERIRRG